MEKLEKLDAVTYDILMYTLKKKRNTWNFEQFRSFREEQGICKETIIPATFIIGLLAYRQAEYSPTDKGWQGKFSEIRERLTDKALKGLPVRWVEYAAHKPGETDLFYGKRPVEKKTGAGDWLYSHKAYTREGIVKEYSKKKTLLHFEAISYGIDIVCEWHEFMAYLAEYRRSIKGPAMGAEYWFKSEPKAGADGSKWILELQIWQNSDKKVKYLRACPFNKLNG